MTFGPGYAPAATIQPLTVAIGAVPSATQLGGARRDRQHRHDRDRRGRRHAHAPARRLGHDRRRRATRATTARSRSTSVPSTRSFTYTNPTAGLAALGRRHGHARASRARRESGNDGRRSRTVGGARPLGRRRRDHRRRRRRRLQRHVRRSPRCRRRARSSTRTRRAGPRQLGRRLGDVLLAVPGPDRRQRLGRDRRQRRQRTRTRTSPPRSTRSRASRARRRSPAPPRPASRSPTPAPSAGIDVPNLDARQPQLRRLLRLGRGDEPRRRERLVHARTTTATSRRRSSNGTNYTAAGILAALDADPARPARPRPSPGFGGGSVQQHRASRSRSPARSPRRTCRSRSRVHELHARARPASSARPTRAAPVDNKGGTVTPTGERDPGR